MQVWVMNEDEIVPWSKRTFQSNDDSVRSVNKLKVNSTQISQ